MKEASFKISGTSERERQVASSYYYYRHFLLLLLQIFRFNYFAYLIICNITFLEGYCNILCRILRSLRKIFICCLNFV